MSYHDKTNFSIFFKVRVPYGQNRSNFFFHQDMTIFVYQSKALVELIRDMLFLKTLKVMQSDYMTKNKKAYIALQKKMYAFVRKCVQYGNLPCLNFIVKNQIVMNKDRIDLFVKKAKIVFGH
jgi:hypothetical protein